MNGELDRGKLARGRANRSAVLELTVAFTKICAREVQNKKSRPRRRAGQQKMISPAPSQRVAF